MDYFKPIIEFLALEIFDLYQINEKKFINKAYEEINIAYSNTLLEKDGGL